MTASSTKSAESGVKDLSRPTRITLLILLFLNFIFLLVGVCIDKWGHLEMRFQSISNGQELYLLDVWTKFDNSYVAHLMGLKQGCQAFEIFSIFGAILVFGFTGAETFVASLSEVMKRRLLLAGCIAGAVSAFTIFVLWSVSLSLYSQWILALTEARKPLVSTNTSSLGISFALIVLADFGEIAGALSLLLLIFLERPLKRSQNPKPAEDIQPVASGSSSSTNRQMQNPRIANKLAQKRVAQEKVSEDITGEENNSGPGLYRDETVHRTNPLHEMQQRENPAFEEVELGTLAALD